MISSCSDEYRSGLPAGLSGCKVGFYAGGVQTRTEMLPNGLSAVWEDGDYLSVWALGADGTYALSNQHFVTYGINADHGYFTSVLDKAMPQGQYTYYCCYPVPVSVDGTKATFAVPSSQDGKVSGGADIMIATPVIYGAMGPLPDPDDHSGMSMEMNRMMHQFRFQIPSTSAELQGTPVERMVLTFPAPVVGNVSFDLADLSSEAVLESSSNVITLNLSDPLSKEKQNYACVAFVPAEFSEGQYLHIKAYTEDKIVEVDPIDLCARNFQPGHSTPVRLVAKALKEYKYSISVKIAANNLGEDINSITFKAPSGCIWPEQASNIMVYEPGRKIKAGDEFVLRFEDESQYRTFSKKTIEVTYDSDNAVTHQTLAVSDLSSVNATTMSLTVPYLFFENFSSIADYGFDVVTGAQGTAVTGYDLSVPNSNKNNVNPGLAQGWTGARTGGGAGQSIRVGSRIDRVLGYTHTYGRLDSPPMSSLKEDAVVNVKVSFRYSGGRDGDSGYSPRAVCGHTYTSGPIDGKTGSFSSDEDGWENIQQPELIPSISLDGSYSNVSQSMTFTIDGCDRDCRISWMIRATGTGGLISNGNQWMYIDDVAVQIVK